ncbi:unnamed protein product [Parajaminaea phylloscopi]
MTSLTTLFVVGPEEYVEFNESLGSKAFLEHVWDQSVTPLKEGDMADSHLHSAGARISRQPPPRIEFPVIVRSKGKGNRYKATGKWISWDELRAKNPLAVCEPPSLAEFQKSGAKVGEGKKLKPGEWLTEEKLKASIVNSANRRSSNDASSTRKPHKGGSSQSIYAVPATPAVPSKSPQLASGKGPKAGMEPKSSVNEAVCSQTSVSQNHRRPGPSLLERFTSTDAPLNEPPLPREPVETPVSPIRTRKTDLSIDIHKKGFALPLLSPSAARTPLSATHPLPETPLKHTFNREETTPNRPHPTPSSLAERRSRPGIAPISPVTPESSKSLGEASEPRGLGLGLGLTPTRPNTFGGPLSPIAQRGGSSSRVLAPVSRILAGGAGGPQSGETASGHTNGSDPSSPHGGPSVLLSPIVERRKPRQSGNDPNAEPATRDAVATPTGRAAEQIEAMLLKLRNTRNGLGAGSSASRWAVSDSSAEAVSSAGKAPPVSQAVTGAQRESNLELAPRLASSEFSAVPSSPPSPAPRAEAALPEVPQPHRNSEHSTRDNQGEPISQETSSPTIQEEVTQEGSVASPPAQVVAPLAETALPCPPTEEPHLHSDAARSGASEVSAGAAEDVDTSGSQPRLVEPEHDPSTSTTPSMADAVDTASAEVDDVSSEKPDTSVSNVPMTPSASTHFDWADDDDEDELPDLGDWGVTLPCSSSSALSAVALTGEDPTSQSKEVPNSSNDAQARPPRSKANGSNGRHAGPPWKLRELLPSEASQGSASTAVRGVEKSRSDVPTGPRGGRGHGPVTHTAGPADGDWKKARADTLAAEEEAEKARSAKRRGPPKTTPAAAARALAAGTSSQPKNKAQSAKNTGPPEGPTIPTGPRGLRIAGTAAESAARALQSGSTVEAGYKAEGNAGLRISGRAQHDETASKTIPTAPRKELLAGTVHSRHAPQPGSAADTSTVNHDKSRAPPKGPRGSRTKPPPQTSKNGSGTPLNGGDKRDGHAGKDAGGGARPKHGQKASAKNETR